MQTNYLVDNICFKLFLAFLIVNLILEQELHKKEANNLEYYFSQSICQLIYFRINYNCVTNLYTNDNFYNDISGINHNINLLMNINKPKLENIFLLLSIIPFLKNNSTLTYKTKNKGIYKYFGKKLNKKVRNKNINFDYDDLHYFNKNIENLLYFKWELIPKHFMLNNLRYIINNYYSEPSLAVLQKSLNINYKAYIQNKANKMTSEEISKLLSMYYY